MRKNVVLSNTREVPLLHFLWKWKITTTAALIRKFFPACQGKTAYNRLLTLRHAGLIQVRSDGLGQKFACTLDQRGFEAIRENLPQLKEEGYKSEAIGHDLLVTAFHLGNWLCEVPEGVSLFSEQQLRRYHPEFYPAWVPQSEVHRPDGYTRIPAGDKFSTFAIEVELNHKRDANYLKIGDFYNHFRTISKVLWLVPRESMALGLEEKLRAATRRPTSPHNFTLLEDFKLLGWESRIVVGPDQSKTLSNLLLGTVPAPGPILDGSNLTQSLLDLRKSPHNSTIYRGFQFGDFCD